MIILQLRSCKISTESLCCARLTEHVTKTCSQHIGLTCPDIVVRPMISWDNQEIEWILCHPDGISGYQITFCPFCGQRLSTAFQKTRVT